MLEYFAYKKVKKHRAEKADKQRLESAKEEARLATASEPPSPQLVSEPHGTRLLREEDQRYLERLTAPDPDVHVRLDVDGARPPLPPRIKTPTYEWDSDTESFVSTTKDAKAKPPVANTATEPAPADAAAKPKRFAYVTGLGRSLSQRVRASTANSGLKPVAAPVTERELEREETEISRVLNDLNLSAQNNKVFSLSEDSAEMVRKFTLVFKDLVNGVPTAYNDLVTLLEDRDGVLARNYEKLPGPLKKLVTTLPEKLTGSLAPELLAVAAESQGMNSEQAKRSGLKDGGLKDAAKSFLTPKSLQDLVTKPGAVVGLLKSIVGALKTRWPAFMGTNVLWSVALFLLLSALWYCHKRGRETRLEREATARGENDPLDGASRIEELPDDPQLPAPKPRRTHTATALPAPTDEASKRFKRTYTSPASSSKQKSKSHK